MKFQQLYVIQIQPIANAPVLLKLPIQVASETAAKYSNPLDNYNLCPYRNLYAEPVNPFRLISPHDSEKPRICLLNHIDETSSTGVGQILIVLEGYALNLARTSSRLRGRGKICTCHEDD